MAAAVLDVAGTVRELAPGVTLGMGDPAVAAAAGTVIVWADGGFSANITLAHGSAAAWVSVKSPVAPVVQMR